MPSISFPRVNGSMSTSELADIVSRLIKEVEWLSNGNIDSFNVRNIAGYNIDRYTLKHESGIVGMSGASPTEAEAIRFWAGDPVPTNAPFRVQQDGTVYSTKGYIGGWVIGTDSITDIAGTTGLSSIDTGGNDIRFWAGNETPSDAPFQVYENGDVTIIGGTIRTNPVGAARIELSGNSMLTYNSSNQLQGPVWGESSPSANYGDFSLYDSGTEVIRFENKLAGNGYLIKSVGGFSSLSIGGVGRDTFGTGTWTFSNPINGDLNGTADTATYADHAGTASSADELSPSGDVSWFQVDKTGSDIADLSTKNLSSLTQSSSYRTVSDTEKTTWNNKANKALEAWVAPTLLNSWANFDTGGNSTAGYYKNDMGEVRLKGRLKNGSTAAFTDIFVLPVGYRPAQNKEFTASCSTGFASVFVTSAGNVQFYRGTNAELSIDTISFRAE